MDKNCCFYGAALRRPPRSTQIGPTGPRGGAEPTHNQLSGAVGGRASSALISIVKASLRAVFRGGSFVDGCGTAAQTALRRCLRLLRRVACCSLRLRRTRLAAHQELMLWRDMRHVGE